MVQNLKDIYYEISNPIGNISSMVRLVNLYSHYPKSSFPRALLQKKTDSSHDDLFRQNLNEYYVFLFNTWRNNILSLSKTNHTIPKNLSPFLEEILELQRYLLTIPAAKTKGDVDLALSPNDKRLKILLMRYGFDREKKVGWNLVFSESISPTLRSHYPVEHFLTITTKDFDTLKFCKIFHKKCIQKHYPYYYKFDMSSRKDNIVIYTDSEHLADYLAILREMKQEYPNLISRCEEPSLFTGKIDSFIGYGSEKDNNTQDFYEIRSNHVSHCCEEVLLHHIKSHPYGIMKGRKSSMSVLHFLAGNLAFNYIDKMHEIYPDSNEFYQKMGISFKEMNQRKFYDSFVKKIEKAILQQTSDGPFQDITISYRKGFVVSKHVLTKDFIANTIRENAPVFYQANPELYRILRTYIQKTSPIYGIGAKYCFDQSSFEKFIEATKNTEKVYQKKES